MDAYVPEVRLRGGVPDHGLVMGVEVGVIVDFKGRWLESRGDLNSHGEILVHEAHPIKGRLGMDGKAAMSRDNTAMNGSALAYL